MQLCIKKIISLNSHNYILKYLFSHFPVVSIEDPFDQDHWQAWSNLTGQTNIQIVGLVQYTLQLSFLFSQYTEQMYRFILVH